MTNLPVRQTVLDVLRTVTRKPIDDEEAFLTLEYLDEGFIDSFQLVEMIATLEQKLDMKFSAAELTSERFRTPGGVIAIIEENVTNGMA